MAFENSIIQSAQLNETKPNIYMYQYDYQKWQTNQMLITISQDETERFWKWFFDVYCNLHGYIYGNLYCLPYLCSLSAVPPCKVQRLNNCNPCHQESINSLHSSTPSRPAVALGTTIRCSRPRHAPSNNGTKVTLSPEQELPSGQSISSPPSPPSPPHSPSLSSSLSSLLYPTLSGTSAEKSHKEGEQSTTSKTPTKLNELNAYSATPLSSSKYHRVLEPSVTCMSPGNESPKASSVSVMDRFNSIYQSLKSKPEWDSELQVDDSTPSLDITSGSHSQGMSSKVLRRAPACPFITVTSSEGERVYLKLQSKKVSTS